MSRLADILSGMDRGAARPVGVGGIAGLGRPKGQSRWWRRGLYLVMLGGMAGLAAVLLAYSQNSAPPAASLPVPAPPPLPAAPPTAPAASFVRRGLEAAQSGAAGEAAGLFRKAIEADPSDVETWNKLGVVLARQGEVTEAMDAFRRALRLDPRHAEAHRNLAVVLDRRGQPLEAIAHYRAFLAQGAAAHPERDGVARRLAEIQKARR